VAIPDPAMPQEKFLHADGRLLSLEAFDLQAWGLPLPDAG
jgi:pseudouridine-5'-monophosphatase